MVFAVISGAFFAFGMQEIGGVVLRSSVEPWYARPGSALFITIMCALFVMGWIGLQEMGRELGKTISIDDIARFFTCIGWGLILITALNWVSYDD